MSSAALRTLTDLDDDRSLHLDLAGLTQLGDRLREANRANPEFEAQYRRLMDVLQTALKRLEARFGPQIERVLAAGDWARDGIDLRNLPYDDVTLEIVLRSAERPFSLYRRLAEEVFAGLGDNDLLIQFRLETLPEWHHAQSVVQTHGDKEALGIPLLIQA